MLPPPGAARIAGSALADAIGTGLFLSGSVVFFNRRLGFDAAIIGVGLSAAGFVALFVVTPLGALTDRVGYARSLRATHALRAVVYPCYLLVHNVAGFVAILVLVTVGDRLAAPVFQALVGSTVGGSRRTETMGYVRALRNAGFSVGALLTSLALAANTRAGYDALALGNAASFAVAGLMLVRVPNVTAPSARSGVLRLRGIHPRYLLMTAINSVLLLHDTILVVALPLYVVSLTRVPATVLPLMYVLNTVLVVVLQRRISRRATTIPDAARAVEVAGWYLAISCGPFAAAAVLSPGPGTVALVVGVVVLTIGESLQIAGAWELSHEHAPVTDRGMYLAVFSMGVGVQRSVGPTLLALFGVLGTATWLPLAASLAVAGRAARWCGHRPPPAEVLPAPAGPSGT
ncbi:MAG TPA: MFS transporter [Mycobacteriales bacterium]|nr:MFS transporter [Mycobacteriales bacterium]